MKLDLVEAKCAIYDLGSYSVWTSANDSRLHVKKEVINFIMYVYIFYVFDVVNKYLLILYLYLLRQKDKSICFLSRFNPSNAEATFAQSTRFLIAT